MKGYLDYSPSDIVVILIFGGMFFLFAYGSVVVVYIKGMREIKQHQTTLGAIIVKAIFFQLASILAVFIIIGVLDIQSRVGQMSNLNFSEATASFFSVDWANLNMHTLVSYYEDNNLRMDGLGLFILIKAIWSLFTVLIVFTPIIILFLILNTILIKHKENRGGIFEVIMDFFTTMIFTYVLFTIHLTFPYIILHNMYSNHKEKIISKVGDDSLIIGLTYSSRAGRFIGNSLIQISEQTTKD